MRTLHRIQLEKRCQLKKDTMEKRFERITRGSINGGVRFGMFSGAFYGLQTLLAEKRGVHDVFNYVCAGSATNVAEYGLTGKKSEPQEFDVLTAS